MKILCKLDGKEVLKEIYKVQVALFGGPGILIYNEDRSELWETHNKKEVSVIRNVIGKSNVKGYVAGHLNENGQIVIEKAIPYKIWKDYRW